MRQGRSAASRLLLGSVLALVLAFVVANGPRAPGPAEAQGRPAQLTAVGVDGALRALDGDRWVTVWPDVGHGAAVTALAWHPSRPELLVVRRTLTIMGESREPSHALVRMDLSTGSEETILDGVGPQAEIAGPRFAPDGRSAFARVECCLAREILRFGVPPADTAPTQGPARAFLDPAVADDTIVSVGPYTPDGRILISVFCCMGDEPTTNPLGLYLVDADLKKAERIVSDVDATPLGLGPGGAWVAVLGESNSDGNGPALVAIDLPSGKQRTLMPPTDPPLASTGDVASDGRIAVAQQRPGEDPWAPLGTLWVVQNDGSRREPPTSGLSDPMAFAWADPDNVSKARTYATVVGPGPRATAATSSGTARPRPIKVYFSKHPDSDGDFAAVFPVDRTAPDQGVAGAAPWGLIEGPTEAERAAGYFSELGEMLKGSSNCAPADFNLRIEAGIATPRFCREVASAGIGQDARAQSAIEATLRQFTTIQRVRLLGPDGDCLFDMSGENRCLAS